MLSKKEYRFQDLEIEQNENVFYVYGDNMQEAMQIVFWLEEFNPELKLIQVGYMGISNYVRKYKVQGKIYTFIMTSYYRNGKIPDAVRNLVKELDKPDAIVYSLKEKKVLFGVENTVSTLAGNATWQRTGRAINFLKNNIPFVFCSYYSKLDKSALEKSKKIPPPRKPGALFVILYLALTLKYSTPALIAFYEHEDLKQNMNPEKKNKDWREDVFQYLYALIMKDGRREKKELAECYKNMKDYYFARDKIESTKEEFGESNLKYIKNFRFEKNIVKHIKRKKNKPLFQTPLEFTWKPKNGEELIHTMFPDVTFYQLSKNCKAGITFETEKIIEICNARSSHKGYFQDSIKENMPTVILPIKLTKGETRQFTDDPYNGEIPAFSELYQQSFEKVNIIILLTDHSKENEYEVEKAKGRKVYKAISKYASIVMDKDYSVFQRYSEQAILDEKGKYEKTKITEDNITCFFETILKLENIVPTFINPPGGSWSDMHLYPTDEFYYYNRNDERADIAYYRPETNTYYVGESKDNSKSLEKTLKQEERKVETITKIIKEHIHLPEIQYKRFAIFNGNTNDAEKILQESNFHYVVVIQENDKEVKLTVVEGNDEIHRK
jgi:hypothetical protein